MKPMTYEVVVYDDGTSAVSLFDRDGETGQQSYVGRDFRDSWETQAILDTIRQPRLRVPVAGEVAALRAEVGLTFKKLCDAATLAGVRERERDEARAEVGALTAERDTVRQQFVDLRASTLDLMTANGQLEEQNGALTTERDALKAAVLDGERKRGQIYRAFEAKRDDLVRAEAERDAANKRAEVAKLALALMEHTDIEHQRAEALATERDALKVALAASDAVGKAQLVETMEAETRLALVLVEVRRYVDLDCCSDATCDVCGILRNLLGETGKEASGDT